MSDEAQKTIDAFPPQESGALLADGAPLPEGDATLFAPIYIAECSPSHLALHSRWYALFLLFLPGCCCLGLFGLAIIYFFVWAVVPNLINMPLALQLQAAWAFYPMLAVGALAIVAILMLCWWVIKRSRDAGPIRFDRVANQLQFGRLSKQQSRPLDTIAALQLLRTTTLETMEKEAFPPQTNWHLRLIDHLMMWWLVRRVIYQLNLVFADGSRLHVTDYRKRSPLQALAQRLAEFLNVPLMSQGTAEAGPTPDPGGIPSN
jgi:hypothetical protein